MAFFSSSPNWAKAAVACVRLAWWPLRTINQHLARPFGCVLHLIVQAIEVHRDHLSFFAARLVNRPAMESTVSRWRMGESSSASAETARPAAGMNDYASLSHRRCTFPVAWLSSWRMPMNSPWATRNACTRKFLVAQNSPRWTRVSADRGMLSPFRSADC